MKQKDIALIVVVSVLAAVVSFLVASHVFVSPKSRTQRAQVVDAINSDMNQPDSRFFNSNSINPTRNSSSNGTNQSPFNSTGH